MPTAPPTARALLATVLLLSMLPPGGVAHHGHDHPQLHIELLPGQDGLTWTFTGALPVQQDATGRFLEVALPSGAGSATLAPDDGPADGDLTITSDPEPVARYRFAADATPAEGAMVNATFHAVTTITPGENVPLSWRVPPVEDIYADIRVPDDYAISQDVGFVPQVHAPRDGLGMRHWIKSDLDVERLEVTLRAAPHGIDAAHADPPAPGLGWLVLIGIALASAGVWYLGHRSARKKGEGP